MLQASQRKGMATRKSVRGKRIKERDTVCEREPLSVRGKRIKERVSVSVSVRGKRIKERETKLERWEDSRSLACGCCD